MRRSIAGLMALLVILLAGFVWAQGAAQRAAEAPKLPAAVAEAFKKAYPDATIRSTSKEVENGKTVFEVESVDRGLNRDLLYAPDGTVLECEEQIRPEALPTPVSEAFRKLYPKATITKAERTTKGQTVRFDLAVKGAPNREVSFTPDGRLVGPEPKK